MATNLINNEVQLDWRHVGYASDSVLYNYYVYSKQYSHKYLLSQRSLYMLLGGTIIVFGFSIAPQITPFNFAIFY
jgi:hypothetical protein